MRKLTVLAMLALVLTAGSVFAVQRHLTPAPNATFAFGAAGVAFGPTTTNNDDTCDIGTAPAATLLLPYFEVDFRSQQTTARTTLFTITNTSSLPQIAHVVLWTDWSYAALDFNIFLTGYDVQPINLYDIFARGIIAPGAIPGLTGSTSGTDIRTTAPGLGSAAQNPTYALPAATITSQATAVARNPNFAGTVFADCQNQPGIVPQAYLTYLQSIFTTGSAGTSLGSVCPGDLLGGVHPNAIGYLTVDVANTCSQSLPGPGYFSTVALFDNVLIGDYQDINPNPATGNYAGGNPMVHIRAIPEGGPAGSTTSVGTNLPFTFYDRYTGGSSALNLRTMDRRQPLPSIFAARWIQQGTAAFNTNYKIWREGLGDPSGFGVANNCDVSVNSALTIGGGAIVRFDEHENATTSAPASQPISPPIGPTANVLPETSSTPTSNTTVFPAPPASGDVGGWMYLNLNNGGGAELSAQQAGYGTGAGVAGAPFTSRNVTQNWVIISMSAEGRFSVDFDAAWLGNGCTGAKASSATVGPAGGVLVCPPVIAGNPAIACTAGTAPYTGTNVTP